jgi:hypothetical protein
MSKYFFIFVSFVMLFQTVKSQTNDSLKPIFFGNKKHLRSNLYFSWGYARCAYSKSTIHLKDLSGTYYPETERTHYYDFKIVKATAHDRPDFDKIGDLVNITIPQFVARVGYYFKKRPDIGIELNYDHAKYVVTRYQTVRVKGQIDGVPINKDTILNPDNFIHFEHTDGANFWMLNFLKRWHIYSYKKPNRLTISCVTKSGAGVVYPRTDVTIFSTNLNNRWHVAGWVAGIETGLRAELFRNFHFEFTGKGVFADYRKVLLLGDGGGSASHYFFAGELIATLGFQF